MEGVLKGIISAAIKKSRNINFECFCNKCSKTAIESHSQSLSNALKIISKEGHLIKVKTGDIFEKKVSVDSYFSKIGIKQASTFKGFCYEHDNKYFKVVDSLESNDITKEALSRLAFRNFAYEERTKEKILFLMNYIIKNTKGLCDVSDIQYHVLGIRNHLQVTKPYYLNRFDRMFELQNYKQINGLIFVLNRLLPLSCSSVIDPTMINSGSLMQHPLHKPLNLVFFNLIPQRDSSMVIFTYFKEQSRYLEKFIKNFKGLENIVFNHCEEILIQPSYYNTLSAEHKSKIVKGLTPWINWEKEDIPDLFKVKLKSPILI